MPDKNSNDSSSVSIVLLLGMIFSGVSLLVGYVLGRTRSSTAEPTRLLDVTNVVEPAASTPLFQQLRSRFNARVNLARGNTLSTGMINTASLAITVPDVSTGSIIPANRTGWRRWSPLARLGAGIRNLRSRQVGFITALLAVGAFVMAALNFRWIPYSAWETPTEALQWAFIGAVLFIISLIALRPHFTDFAVSREASTSYSVNWFIILLSAGALYLVAKVNGIALSDEAALNQAPQLSEHAQFILLVLASIGLIIGFGGFIEFRTNSVISLSGTQTSSSQLLILGIVELSLPVVVPILFSLQLSLLLNAVLVILGLLTIIYGAGLTVKRGSGPFIQFHFPPLRRIRFTRHTLALLLIVAIGFALRVWQLDTAVHVTVDEMHFWRGVLALRNSPNMHILMPIDFIASFTHIYPYFQQLAINLFGSDFLAMRFPSAVIGTLEIFAIYLLVRQGLDDKNTALLAAALLAVFPPHIHFSRTALNNIAEVLPGTMAAVFFIRGLKHNTQRDYVSAGVFFGWTCFFYEGGRLLFLGLFLSYLVYMVITQRPWSHMRNWALMIICAVLVVAPYYYAMSKAGYSFSMRFMDRGGPEMQKYADLYNSTHSISAVLTHYYDNALKLPFYHIIYSPDSSKLYYGGQTPLLQWFLVPFFLLGIILSLLVFRRFGFLLLLWIVGTGVGASLVAGPDWTARLVVYFVPIVIVVIIGLRYPFDMLIDSMGSVVPSTQPQLDQAVILGKFKIVLYALMATFLIQAGVYQVHYYFVDHLQTYNREVRQFKYDFLDAFYRAISVDPNSHLVFVVNYNNDHPRLDDEELGNWIAFKNVSLTYELVEAQALTSEKITELQQAHKNQTLIFAIEPTQLVTDDYGMPLDKPIPIPVNQKAHDLIVNTFHDVTAQNVSPYKTVPIFQQYQMLVVPADKNTAYLVPLKAK